MTDFSFPTNLQYKALSKQMFTHGDYSIVPIRMMDRMQIMKWRNEQLYHLRQNNPLTAAQQDDYFKQIVLPQFDEQTPPQLLFSYLENGVCIGYGGLVHINWQDKNAEISFLMDTSLEKENFCTHWSMFLSLIQKVAFLDIKLHKIFTYAYDLRPKLYESLIESGFIEDARLKDHCFIENEFRDVVIYYKICN